MPSAATVLQRAREDAGLSRRALARRAGVPISTISRIEEGEVDPTLTMLERVVSATGRQLTLEIEAIPERRSLAALADAWDPSRAGPKINWTRLRAFLDSLHGYPDDVELAIATPPPRSGLAQLDSLLAAIAEKLADDAGVNRPRWCAAVRPLPTPWLARGTPRMIQQARRKAPRQFKQRNIWLSENDLWRDRG